MTKRESKREYCYEEGCDRGAPRICRTLRLSIRPKVLVNSFPHIAYETLNGFKITAIEFSPNSRWLVRASENGSLLLWQMTSGTVTSNILMPANEGRINSFAFSADSSKLVTSCMNGTARVLELEAKIPIASPIALDSNGGVQLTFATFGPRDTWVLTGDEIGQIHSLDSKELNAQQLDYRVPEQTKGVGMAIRHVFIRPDGKQFITSLRFEECIPDLD